MRSVRYHLSNEEIEESLLCLDFKIEGRFKRWNVGILSLLGTVLLVQYLRFPEKFYFALGGLAVIALLMGILYVPLLGRRRRALKMGNSQSDYQFQFTDNAVIAGDTNLVIPFSESLPLLLDSENVLTLRMQKTVFCIPKRGIDGEFIEALKASVMQNKGKVYNVSTQGRVIRHGKKDNGKIGKSVGK